MAVAVLSQQYCLNHPMDLSFEKEITLKDPTFGVTDADGNVVFKIRMKLLSVHYRRTLLDAAGNPIVTFHQKFMTAHRRWQAFRGESTDPKDMIFSVKKSTMIQFKSKLKVFMAANVEEKRCDFRIEGDWSEIGTCIIYAGDTTNIIAKMHKEGKHKDKFVVTVFPNVDHAFIVALVLILQEINEHDRSASLSLNMAKGGPDILGALMR